jgi:hypothetical protein
VKLKTRRERRTIDILRRTLVGLFVLVFVASVVGVAVVTLTTR